MQEQKNKFNRDFRFKESSLTLLIENWQYFNVFIQAGLKDFIKNVPREMFQKDVIFQPQRMKSSFMRYNLSKRSFSKSTRTWARKPRKYEGLWLWYPSDYFYWIFSPHHNQRAKRNKQEDWRSDMEARWYRDAITVKDV